MLLKKIDYLIKKKNLLIGDWCFDLKNKYNTNYSFEIPIYHWCKKKKRIKDYKYLFKTYKFFLSRLSKDLNTYHKTNYSLRAWEIILYKWLWTYLLFIFDRWEQILKVTKEKTNLKTKIINYPSKDFIPLDSYQFASLMIYNSNWNHWVLGKILVFQNKVKCSVLKKSNDLDQKVFLKKKFSYSNINRLNLNNFLTSKSLYSQNTFFPKKFLLKFIFLFKQFRFKKIIYFNKNMNFDIESRKKLFFLKSKNKFFNFAYNFISYNLPKTYFEDFLEIKKILKYSNLPEKPKNILTAIDQNYNDLFKIFVAEKIMSGSKLFLMQHGGGYGIISNHWWEKLELKICNKFLTWGWKNKNKKIVPFFIQKTAGLKFKKNFFCDGLLLAIDDFPLIPQSTLEGIPKFKGEIDKYIENINTFLLALDKLMFQKCTLKYLNHSTINEDFYVLSSLKSKFINLNFSFSSKNIFYLSKKFKLVIEYLNSTSFLELLSLNIPVILIYDECYSGIRKSVLKEFKMLEKFEIIHKSPAEAAKFVNKNYNSIDRWWNNKSLQEARKIFCSRFAKNSSNYLKELKAIL